MGYLYIALNFGVTAAVTIYLLMLGGQWIDDKFNSDPIFMMLGVLLGVAISFRSIFLKMKAIDKFEKNRKEAKELKTKNKY